MDGYDDGCEMMHHGNRGLRLSSSAKLRTATESFLLGAGHVANG